MTLSESVLVYVLSQGTYGRVHTGFLLISGIDSSFLVSTKFRHYLFHEVYVNIEVKDLFSRNMLAKFDS